ncbi:unnamed protein product [Lampetra fluviatilis]
MDMGARRERARNEDARASCSGSDSARSQASSGSRHRNVEGSSTGSSRRASAEGGCSTGCRHPHGATGFGLSSGCHNVEGACLGSRPHGRRGESGFDSRCPNEDGSSWGSRQPSAESSSLRSRLSCEEDSKLRCRHRHHNHQDGGGGERDRGARGERGESISGSGGTSYRSDDDDEDDEEEDNDVGGCRRVRIGSCAPCDHTDLSAMSSSSQPSDSCCCCSSECSTERTGTSTPCCCCTCGDQQGQQQGQLQSHSSDCSSERTSWHTQGPGTPTRQERGHRLKDVGTGGGVDGKDRKAKRGSVSSSQDDQEAAGRAVALVINGARRGFVPLCVDVAGLLRSQRRLRRMVESQALEIERLRQRLGHVGPAELSPGGSCGSSAKHRCTASIAGQQQQRHHHHHNGLLPGTATVPKQSDIDWEDENGTESDINGTKPNSCFLPPMPGVTENVLHCARLNEALSAGETHRAHVHSAAEQVAAHLGSRALRNGSRNSARGRQVEESSSGSACSSTCAFSVDADRRGQTSVIWDKDRVCDLPGTYGGIFTSLDGARGESCCSAGRRRSGLSLDSSRPSDGSISEDEPLSGTERRVPRRPDLWAETQNPEPVALLPHGAEREGRDADAGAVVAVADGVKEAAVEPGLAIARRLSEERPSAAEMGITHSFDPGGRAQPRARRPFARKSGQAEASPPPQSNCALRRLKRFQLSQLTCKLR